MVHFDDLPFAEQAIVRLIGENQKLRYEIKYQKDKRYNEGFDKGYKNGYEKGKAEGEVRGALGTLTGRIYLTKSNIKELEKETT